MACSDECQLWELVGTNPNACAHARRAGEDDLNERLGEFDLESGGAALSCALRAQ